MTIVVEKKVGDNCCRCFLQQSNALLPNIIIGEHLLQANLSMYFSWTVKNDCF